MGVRAGYVRGKGVAVGHFYEMGGGAAEEKTSTSGGACCSPSRENIAGKQPFDGMEASFLAPHGTVNTFARGGGNRLIG